MGHSKGDVVSAAIGILDEHGLPGLSMRRLAATLGLQQSALYWHFESKQLLLAAVAEEILRRGPADLADGDWETVAAESAKGLREALLAHRDGAEVVSTVYAFGLGATGPHRRLKAHLESAGMPTGEAQAAATLIVHFVFGLTFSEQQYLQASRAGAIPEASPAETRAKSETDAFAEGIALVLDGVRARRAERRPA